MLELKEVYEDFKFFYMVTEETKGGIPFFDKIASMESFSENDAAMIMEQLFKAMNCLH